ncbi:hypothetical protein ACQ4M3_09585 [Leptolyngbya sp. AN03gr2]|uniref:hypothetical protein n=1 Tax=Leptolyngbya sp. AN03gr2 TaxID=3423364 RepID=UPI003D31AA70
MKYAVSISAIQQCRTEIVVATLALVYKTAHPDEARMMAEFKLFSKFPRSKGWSGHCMSVATES